MAASTLLLDTGALVSLLDRSQRLHEACVEVFEAWTDAVVSTEAVLTEATHLMGRKPGGREACAEFFLKGVPRWSPPYLLRCCAAAN